MVILLVDSKVELPIQPCVVVFLFCFGLFLVITGLLKICGDTVPFKVCHTKEHRIFTPYKQFTPKMLRGKLCISKIFSPNSPIKLLFPRKRNTGQECNVSVWPSPGKQIVGGVMKLFPPNTKFCLSPPGDWGCPWGLLLCVPDALAVVE